MQSQLKLTGRECSEGGEHDLVEMKRDIFLENGMASVVGHFLCFKCYDWFTFGARTPVGDDPGNLTDWTLLPNCD